MPSARPVQLMRAGLEGGNRVDDSQSTITVPVPIDPDIHSAGAYDLVEDEADETAYPSWSRVPNRVAHDKGSRPPADRLGKYFLYHIGTRTSGVFGHKHHRQTFVHRKANRLLAMSQNRIQSQPFGILADRTGANERGDLDRATHLMGNLHDGADVRDYGAGGAIGMNSACAVR